MSLIDPMIFSFDASILHDDDEEEDDDDEDDDDAMHFSVVVVLVVVVEFSFAFALLRYELQKFPQLPNSGLYKSVVS